MSVIGNIDVGTLSLNGSTANLSLLSGAIAGVAQLDKVLSLDSSSAASLTSTTFYGTTANIQFMNTDILNAAINVSAPIFYAGGTAFISSTRDMSNINTLTFAAFVKRSA